MTYGDVPHVERLTATAFHEQLLATRPADWPAPELRTPDRAQRWAAWLIHLLVERPRAIRRYRLAGFEVHPAMLMWGYVQRATIPQLPGLRDGDAADIDLLDQIDRAARGFGHGVDHEAILSQLALVVVERGSARGYAYITPDGAPYLVAATDGEVAQAALWRALAHSTPDVAIHFSEITSHQSWAVDVGLQARLELHNHGYVAVRGMAAPWPYLPSGHFL